MSSEKMKRAVAEWKSRNLELEQQVAEQATDLQQKNRELEIEAAARRVRAAAMGMQTPEDIMDVLRIVKEEISKFDLENIATWIWTKDDKGLITQWDILEVIEEGNLVNFNLSFDINNYPEVNRHTKEWEKGKTYYTLNWQGEKLQAVIDEVADVDPESGKMFREAVEVGQIRDYWHAASPFSRGVVGLDFVSPPPETAEPILTKMADTFGMAYQRFEDLLKSEAQASEAKIETALERIRSRSMAMQNSDELSEVVRVMYDEVEKLEISKRGCALMIFDNNNKNIQLWFSEFVNRQHARPYNFDNLNHELVRKWWEFWESEDEFMSIHLKDEECDQWTNYMFENTGMKDLPEEVKEGIRSENEVYFEYAKMKQGLVSFINLEPFSEEIFPILKRIARTFEQAYTRFLDVQKAEQQAYESKVEASLERVRGMASAMNHSDDLMQIAEAMFREMEILKINPLRYGIGIIDGEKQEAELWASTVNDGHYLDMLGTISLTWHPMLRQVLDAWDAQHEEVIYELKGKERSDYYRKIGQVNPDIPNLEALQDPKADITEFVSFFPFKSGALYAFTESEPGEDGKSILKRFSGVFEQAHIRYNDLQVAENQDRLIREERDRLEIALKELEATKDQLVQQEKLASLGQLTAGIAHEIKNPLNFVNNFSELSVDLVEEAKDELSAFSHQLSAVDAGKVEEALLILEDIEANLRKIHEHGSRADGIVKSMLEHSRGGSGEMERTDLNALVKEFVNLSFHGMRAGKDSINVDIDLQLDDAIGEIPLVAEDFSRVILNLCNNAFDAMREKGIKNSELKIKNYSPRLTVRTKVENGKVVVEVEDNGPGIPEDIKHKILQPFFTTKKGTAGTGLGLSITNDIIKAHGGNMMAANLEKSGARFTINLPSS